jgi:superfamily II DNA/RNA helicase
MALKVIRGTLERDGGEPLRSEVYFGEMSGEARYRALERFRNDPDCRVLFITRAGSTGL